MSPIANCFFIISMIGLMWCGTLYEAKQERAEFEQALLQVYEEEGLKEYARSLSYQIDDLRTRKYYKYYKETE